MKETQTRRKDLARSPDAASLRSKELLLKNRKKRLNAASLEVKKEPADPEISDATSACDTEGVVLGLNSGSSVSSETSTFPLSTMTTSSEHVNVSISYHLQLIEELQSASASLRSELREVKELIDPDRIRDARDWSAGLLSANWRKVFLFSFLFIISGLIIVSSASGDPAIFVGPRPT